MSPVFKKNKINVKTWIGIILLIILVPIIGFTLIKPGSSEAAWFDDTWGYRKKIPVSTHTASETNVYIGITVDTAALTTDKLQADCDDLRFTKLSGELLPYQIVSGCDSATTSIRIGFDTMPAAPFDFYMYYGNPGAQIGSSTLGHAACGNGCATGTVGNEEQSLSPVAYWRLDEGVDNTCSGGTNDVCNAVSGGTDGAKTNATWATEELCLSGKCLKFDGDGDYVDFGDAYDMGTGDYTFSLWFRTSDTDYSLLSKSQLSANDNRFAIFNDADTGLVALLDSGPINLTSPVVTNVSDNRWHLATAVYDRDGNLTLYIDSVSKGTVDISAENGDNVSSAFNLFIGSYNDNTGTAPYATSLEYQGFIDEVKIYKYARTAAQIKADYTSKDGSIKGVTANIGGYNQKSLSDGLVGYWKMDESAANGCTGGANDNCDSSGNGFDGAWNGNATAAAGKFGNATTYDGTGDYTEVTHNSAMSFLSTDSFTLASWIYVPNLPGDWKSVIAKSRNSAPWYGIWIDSSNQWTFGGTANITGSAVTTGWHHVVVLQNAANQSRTIYVDGVSTGTGAAQAANGTGNLVFAADNSFPSENFNGKLEEIRLYNRALSSSEVRQLYNWATGPVAHWKFDEKTGQTAYDSSGNAFNGTFGTDTSVGSDDPTWTSGKIGGGIQTDGSNDYVKVSDNSSLEGFYQMSLCGWGKLTAYHPSDASLLAVKPISGDPFELWGLWVDTGGTVSFAISNGTARDVVTSATTFSLNTWNYICGVYNGANLIVYINGQQDPNSTSSTKTIGTNANNVLLGAYLTNGTDVWNGQFDEIKLYNYARSSSQIMEDMNAGHPIGGSPVSSQLVYWPFDEGQGTTANNVGTASSSNGTLTSIASPATSTSGWTSSGKINKAIVFDGSDDNVLITNANDAAVDYNGSESFSMSTWVYPTTMAGSSEYDAIIAKWEDQTTDRRGYRLVLTNDDADTTGNFRVEMYDESADQTISAAGTNDSVSVNTWYHVSFTFNGGVAGAAADLNLYVNGKLVSSNSANASFLGLEDVATDFTVGDYDSGDNTAANTLFTGRIDEIKVYSGVLSIDNIQVDMNGGGSLAVLPAQSSVNEASYITDGAGNPPIGYWNMDEKQNDTCSGGSNDVCDKSGYGNDGAITGATWTKGKIGSALNFDGNGDYYTVNKGSYDIYSGTVSMWLTNVQNWNDLTIIQSPFSTAQDGNGDLFNIEVTDTDSIKVQFWDGYSANLRTATVINWPTANTWHHLAVTWNGSLDNSSNAQVYLDGVKLTMSADQNITTDAIGATLNIGGNNPIGDREDWTGKIDDVKIYNYARTPAQIAYDYNRGGPVGHWQFDECQGTTVNDNSSTNRTGTITVTAQTIGTCNTGSTAWGTGASGKLNSSIYLDGTGDFVDLGDPSDGSYDMGTHDFSASFWYKGTASGTFLVAKAYNPPNWSFFISSNKAVARITTTTPTNYDVTGTTTINDGSWHMITAVWDRDGNASIYTDGKFENSTSIAAESATDLNNTNDVAVGGNCDAGCVGSGNYTAGQFDDVRIYNYALTATQIKILYNDGSLKFGPTSGTPAP